MRRYSYLRNENDDKVSVRLLTWQWLHKATKASVVGLDSSWVLLRRSMYIYLSRERNKVFFKPCNKESRNLLPVYYIVSL